MPSSIASRIALLVPNGHLKNPSNSSHRRVTNLSAYGTHSLPYPTRNTPCRNHAVVWLDQAEAHVIHFTRDAAESEVIKTTSQHQKAGVVGNNRAEEDTTYMDEVATAITAAKEILIVGPGMEKLSFMRHLTKHHGDTAGKVIAWKP